MRRLLPLVLATLALGLPVDPAPKEEDPAVLEETGEELSNPEPLDPPPQEDTEPSSSSTPPPDPPPQEDIRP